MVSISPPKWTICAKLGTPGKQRICPGRLSMIVPEQYVNSKPYLARMRWRTIQFGDPITQHSQEYTMHRFGQHERPGILEGQWRPSYDVLSRPSIFATLMASKLQYRDNITRSVSLKGEKAGAKWARNRGRRSTFCTH